MGLLIRKITINRDYKIINKLGLHARPCSKFVKLAGTFKSEIWVTKDEEEVNGKSIMGLMMLAAGEGSVLNIRCEGSDAEEAQIALGKLIAGKFDEE